MGRVASDLGAVGLAVALVDWGWPWGVAAFVGVPVLYVASGAVRGALEGLRDVRAYRREMPGAGR